MAGIVYPAVLVDGTVVGRWNLKNRALTVTLFSPVEQAQISQAAGALWGDLKRITFE